MDELLPIGSIVLTSQTLKKIIIIGFLPKKETIVYDYVGVVLDNNKEKVFFNHDNISNIIFVGYQTRESILYQKIVKDTKHELKETEDEIETVLKIQSKYLKIKEETK